MTREELKQVEQLSLAAIKAEQDKLNKIRKQLKELEPPVDYESYVGKCFYEEYNDGVMFYKIVKLIYQNEPVFITLVTNHLGDWNNPGIAIELDFKFIYIRAIKLLEEMDLADYQDKLGQTTHHLSEIIYNNSTKTPYD